MSAKPKQGFVYSRLIEKSDFEKMIAEALKARSKDIFAKLYETLYPRGLFNLDPGRWNTDGDDPNANNGWAGVRVLGVKDGIIVNIQKPVTMAELPVRLSISKQKRNPACVVTAVSLAIGYGTLVTKGVGFNSRTEAAIEIIKYLISEKNQGKEFWITVPVVGEGRPSSNYGKITKSIGHVPIVAKQIAIP